MQTFRGRARGLRFNGWLVASIFVLSHSVLVFGGQQYAVVILGSLPETSVGFAAGTGQQVGFEIGDSRYATLWTGAASSAINLNPLGYRGSIAYATDGTTQVGMAYGPVTGNYAQAALWQGSASSFTNLNPAGAQASQANGVDGNLVAGQASSTTGATHAILWNTSTSTITDLNPSNATYSIANAVSGNEEGGTAQFSDGYHAVIWNGSAQSWVDLTPPNGEQAEVYGMSGNQQVGVTGLYVNAALWNGSEQSYVNLNGALNGSIAYATNGIQQVGEGNPIINGISQGYHAVVWSGSSDYVDLSTFLPAPFADSTSVAMGIDASGDIIGEADYRFEEYGQAVMWVPIPEPGGACLFLLVSVFALCRRPDLFCERVRCESWRPSS